MNQYTTVEQMETETQNLKENALLAGAVTWEDRKKSQTPQCKFGEDGICCRICSMGPCRITPKAPRGICGADADAIAGRNYLRFIAGGAAAHSDHGREICHTLYETSAEGNYQITDVAKLLHLAKEWDVPYEDRDIYEVAHDVAMVGLMEYGKPFGTQRFLTRATQERQEIWDKQGVAPRAIDREITTLHAYDTHGQHRRRRSTRSAGTPHRTRGRLGRFHDGYGIHRHPVRHTIPEGHRGATSASLRRKWSISLFTGTIRSCRK